MTGIYLVVAMVALALMLSANLFLKSSIFKLVIITYTFFVASMVYFSFDTYKGWPSSAKAPAGQVLSIHIVEPRGRLPGAIYFWSVANHSDVSWLEKLYTFYPEGEEVPRAHRIEYTKKTAMKFQQALSALQNGMIVLIEDLDSVEGDDSQLTGDVDENDGRDRREGDGSDDEYDAPRLKIKSPEDFFKKG